MDTPAAPTTRSPVPSIRIGLQWRYWSFRNSQELARVPQGDQLIGAVRTVVDRRGVEEYRWHGLAGLSRARHVPGDGTGVAPAVLAS
jgi:hypothetical protein